MSSKYFKQEVIDNRLCGLKYVDKALLSMTREQLIEEGIRLAKDHYGTGKAWWTFDWGIGNAVINAVKSDKSISQTWNLDEFLTDDEMSRVASELEIQDKYEAVWKRKVRKRPV
jgi:hypothetical protein